MTDLFGIEKVQKIKCELFLLVVTENNNNSDLKNKLHPALCLQGNLIILLLYYLFFFFQIDIYSSARSPPCIYYFTASFFHRFNPRLKNKFQKTSKSTLFIRQQKLF